MNGQLTMSGKVALKVIRSIEKEKHMDESIWRRIVGGLPFGDLNADVRAWRIRNMINLYRGLKTVLLAKSMHLPCMWGELELIKILADGRRIDYGLASLRVVTTTGVGFIVDAFQNSVELENMKYHALGTGTNVEAAANTALQTELTTEYETDNTRATGTTAEGASANIYQTVGTNTLNSGTPAVTEHGILSQAANSGGVLLDRSVFAAINLDGTAGDSLQSTYSLTFTAGS